MREKAFSITKLQTFCALLLLYVPVTIFFVVKVDAQRLK